MKYRHGKKIALVTINCDHVINETKPSMVDMNDYKHSNGTPSALAYIKDHGLHYQDFNFEDSRELLGSGFFAEVYKVRDSLSGLNMAFKVPKKTESMNRFMKEIRLLKRLNHDNILRFYGSCVFDGYFGCLTEYLDSGNLSSLIETQGLVLGWSTGVDIIDDISQGLAYLHEQYIVHRDLSSENILLQQKNNLNSTLNIKYRAVIADFGLFLNLKQIGSDQISTVGNPFYTAPENLKNQSPYNYFSDVFSFGMILCELITGLKNDPNNIARTNNFGLDYTKLKVKKDCPKWLHGLACDCCMVYVNNRPTMQRACEIIIENKKYIRLWKCSHGQEDSEFKLSSSMDAIKLRRMTINNAININKMKTARLSSLDNKHNDYPYLNGVKELLFRPICRYNSVDSFINPRLVNLHKAFNDPGYSDKPLTISMKKLDPRIHSPVLKHLAKKLSRCSSESDLTLLITPNIVSNPANVVLFAEYSPNTIFNYDKSLVTDFWQDDC